MANKETLHLTVGIALLLAISAGAADTPAPAGTKYTNHTVGGSGGWFFNATTNKTSANYATWAASQTFNLGDFLIFNTDSNQTIVQTSSKASYKSCSMQDDTVQFYGGNTVFSQAATVPIALTTTGISYFFSDAADGEQCRHGLAFAINVGHGLGLPPSLNQPPPPAYVPPPSPTEDVSPPAAVSTTGTPEGSGGARERMEVGWVSGLVVFVGGLVIM